MLRGRRWKLTRPMRSVLLMVFSQVLFLTVTGQGVRANDLVLVSDGKARMTITYADTPTDKERAAAKRLQYVLAKMTGVSLPIAPLSQAQAASARVLLGPRAAQTVGMDIGQSYPGGERVMVKKVGKNLVLLSLTVGDSSVTVLFRTSYVRDL